MVKKQQSNGISKAAKTNASTRSKGKRKTSIKDQKTTVNHTALAVFVAILAAAIVYIRNKILPPSTWLSSANKCHPKRRHLCSQSELELAAAANEHFVRGQQLFNSGNIEDSKIAFEASLQIDSTSAFASDTYQNLGLALAKLGDVKGSMTAYKNAIKRDKTSVYAHYSLANALSRTNNQDDWEGADVHYKIARRELAKSGEEEEGNPKLLLHVLNGRGMVLRRIGERGHSNIDNHRRYYLVHARKQFKQAFDVVQSGKVPPSSGIDVINNLHDLLRDYNYGDPDGESNSDELMKWAVQQGIWRDKRQHPRIFNHDLYDAIAKQNGNNRVEPWIENPERHPALKRAMDKWKQILEEYNAAKASGLHPVGQRVDLDTELYNKKSGEDWSEYPLISDGIEHAPQIAPTATSIFRDVIPPMGTLAFSSITAGTNIKPHCGPTNEIITCHLGVLIPPHESIYELGISAGGEKRGWNEGQWICFEDSMEHTVWNRSEGTRVVLIAQLKHPYWW